MSAEVAGPVTTHPQLLPEGGHSSVGGHGILGSAGSSLVGVSTLGYPSGLADPLDSSRASEGQITAESAITTTTATTSSSNEVVTSRQPPTIAAEVTAAAFSSPTYDPNRRVPECELDCIAVPPILLAYTTAVADPYGGDASHPLKGQKNIFERK